MNNANANLTLSEIDDQSIHDFDFSELENQLENDLSDKLADLEMSEEDRKNISNPDKLGTVVYDTVMEHINNQIPGLGAEEFIAKNGGMTLDLRNSAHIQTVENFKQGNIATHNNKTNIKANYDRFRETPHGEFRKKHVDPGTEKNLPRAGKLYNNGQTTVKDTYTGRDISTETTIIIDGKRVHNHGAAQREHVTSSSEIYKDPSLQMANEDPELAQIINDPENLQGYTTMQRNNRKSDNSSEEMEDKDKTKHWEKADKKSKDFLKKKRKEGEERLIKEGKQTQKEEAVRIATSAGKAIGIQLLVSLLKDFLKEVTHKLIAWFKSSKKKIETFLSAMKDAIHDFITNLRNEIGKHIKNALETGVKLLVGAIFKPMASIIRKFGAMISQGFKSLKEAIAYLREPTNKNKPFSIKIAQIGKIVVAGLTGAGAILLGQAIESGISKIPVVGQFLAFEIPLIGSLSSLIGLFMGALVSGILGAIALNMIDKFIARRLEQEAVKEQITKGNEIIATQYQLKAIREEEMQRNKHDIINSIRDRHLMAADKMRESISKKESIEKEVKQRAEKRIEKQRIDDLKLQEELKIAKENYFREELKTDEEIKVREEKKRAEESLMKDELEKIKEMKKSEEKKSAERSKLQGNSINQNDSNNFDFDGLFEQLNKL